MALSSPGRDTQARRRAHEYERATAPPLRRRGPRFEAQPMIVPAAVNVRQSRTVIPATTMSVMRVVVFFTGSTMSRLVTT